MHALDPLGQAAQHLIIDGRAHTARQIDGQNKDIADKLGNACSPFLTQAGKHKQNKQGCEAEKC